MSDRKVLLVGMMGAGKTSVGTALAARLGCPYVDNDALLERTTGTTAPKLLEAQGSAGLAQAESRVLTLLLGMPGPMVGSVPGGIVLDPTDRDRLAASDAHVVWLRTTVPVLVRRIGNGAGRARLGDDPATALRALAAERNAYYELVADQVVDTDTHPAGAIAKLVLEVIS